MAQKDVVLYSHPKVQIMIHHDYLIKKAFQVFLNFEKKNINYFLIRLFKMIVLILNFMNVHIIFYVIIVCMH